MQKRTKKVLLILAAIVVFTIAGLAAKNAYDKQQITQRLLKEEIYMFQDTYLFWNTNAGGFLYAYYMVCEPVDDKVQLVEKLERLVEEKKVVQGAKDYYRDMFEDKYGYDNLRISIDFYKPSKEFPIGWQPLEVYSMEDYPEIVKDILISINMPWDAESMEEHTYYFWKMTPPLNTMDIDEYKWQAQADGSFKLVLEEESRSPRTTPSLK